MKKNKKIIYQLLPRLFGPGCSSRVFGGTLEENGCGKLNDLSDKALSEIRNLGVTDIWITGVIRHASSTAFPADHLEASHPDLLKGMAGSPYAIKDYYDIHPDLAVNVSERMTEFEELIARAQNQHMGIIIDFVPNHVSRDYFSVGANEETESLGSTDETEFHFHPDNNFYYLPGEELVLPVKKRRNKGVEKFREFPAKVTGNDVFHSKPGINDWYETIKLNYGVNFENGQSHFYPAPDTWKKMLEILVFWAEKRIAGFRCDMAGMVPSAFWKYAISSVKNRFPDLLFIAEIYEPERYREFVDAGFDYLYDKAGLYDLSRAILEGRETTRAITRHWQKLEGLDDYMLRFLENHDEQRIASRFFAQNPWKGLPAMALACLMNRGPALVYFGQELGEPAEGKSGFSGDDGRTSIFDYTHVPTIMQWIGNGSFSEEQLSAEQVSLRKAYQQLLFFTSRNPIISTGHFYDLMWVNEDLNEEIRSRVFAFLRYLGQDCYLIAVSFSSTIRNIQIRLTDHALRLCGLEDQNRISIHGLHPKISRDNLLISQISSTGIQLEFDKTGWVVKKLGTEF